MERVDFKRVFDGAEALGEKTVARGIDFIGKTFKTGLVGLAVVAVALVAFMFGSFLLRKKRA